MSPAGDSAGETLAAFALAAEAAPFLARRPPHTRVALLGVGADRASRTLEQHLSAHRPARVILAGFSGGLDPALSTGDLLVDPALSTPDLAAHALACLPSARAGRFHQAAQPAANPSDKQLLRASTQADAVDMESASLAATCRRLGLPHLSLRAILDPADLPLPLPNPLPLRPDDGQPDRVAIACHFLRSGRVGAAIDLARRSRLAAARLAAALAALAP